MTDIKGIQAGVKEQSEKVISELQTLRDEIKLKLHLASAEGKDAWNKLEPQLAELEQRLGGATDAAKSELASAGTELKAGFDRLYKSLSKELLPPSHPVRSRLKSIASAPPRVGESRGATGPRT